MRRGVLHDLANDCPSLRKESPIYRNQDCCGNRKHEKRKHKICKASSSKNRILDHITLCLKLLLIRLDKSGEDWPDNRRAGTFYLHIMSPCHHAMRKFVNSSNDKNSNNALNERHGKFRRGSWNMNAWDHRS